MKTLKTMALGAITLATLTFSSCTKDEPIPDPTACFTISGEQVVGQELYFGNCSSNSTDYLWYLGDGTSTKNESPIYTYVTPGTYDIELIAYNSDRTTKSTTQTITVIEKLPTNMIINSIIIRAWPQTDNGAAWDNNSYPDLFPMMYKDQTEIYMSSTYFEDCNPSKAYLFDSNSGLPLTIGSLSERYSLIVYDYDSSSPNDFMGGIDFTPAALHANGKNTVTLSAGEFILELGVSWTY